MQIRRSRRDMRKSSGWDFPHSSACGQEKSYILNRGVREPFVKCQLSVLGVIWERVHVQTSTTHGVRTRIRDYWPMTAVNEME